MFLQILRAQFAVPNKKPDMSKISSDLYIFLPKRKKKKKKKSQQTAAAMRYLTDLDREKADTEAQSTLQWTYLTRLDVTDSVALQLSCHTPATSQSSSGCMIV